MKAQYARKTKILSEETSRSAIAQAINICDGLPSPDARSYPGLKRRTAEPRGLSGSSGYVVANTAAALVTGQSRFFVRASEELRNAAASESGPSSGLFTGVAGVALAALFASNLDEKCEVFAERCFDYVANEVPPEPYEAAKSMADYDVISGAAGVLLALTASRGVRASNIMRYLTWLIDDDTRWRCPHPLAQNDLPRNDLGFAHGLDCVPARGV